MTSTHSSQRFSGLASWYGLALIQCSLLVCLPGTAWATWSVIALDRDTGQMTMALASCVDIEATVVRKLATVMVPGKGVAACQAAVDLTRADQAYVFEALKRDLDPARIIAHLRTGERFTQRQYGVVDMQGRYASASGATTPRFSKEIAGQIVGTQIFYSIQGNIVAEAVIARAATTFIEAGGSLVDRTLSALEAGDRAGGDLRCKCPPAPQDGTSPLPCDDMHANFAYLVMADRTVPPAQQHDDQTFVLNLTVSPPGKGADQIDFSKGESLNPIKTLRLRYARLQSGDQTAVHHRDQ